MNLKLIISLITLFFYSTHASAQISCLNLLDIRSSKPSIRKIKGHSKPLKAVVFAAHTYYEGAKINLGKSFGNNTSTVPFEFEISQTVGIDPLVLPPLIPKGLKYSLDWNGRKRSFTLPSIVNEIRKFKNVKAVIFAGNTFYDGTRHNLGFHLADDLITKHFESELQITEDVEALFDDNTVKSGVQTFKTANGIYRSENGEIIPILSPNGTLIVLIKPIGDYNEIGDFAVPALVAMGVEPKNAALVSDNLDTELSKIDVASGVINPNGNNSVVSINRNLAVYAVKAALNRSHPLFASFDSRKKVEELRDLILQKLSVRTGNKKIADLETLKAHVLKGLKQIFKNDILKDELEELKGQTKALNKEKGPLLKQVHTNKDLTDLEREALILKVSEIEQRLAPFTKALKDREQQLQEDFHEYVLEVETAITNHMSYSRVSLGTGRPDNETSLTDFVLGDFPKDVFNDEYWQAAAEAIFKLHSIDQ